MQAKRMFVVMQVLLILTLVLTGCAGQVAVEGEGGLDLGIGSGGEEGGQGGSAQGGLSPLMIVLIVGAVIAIAAVFLRSRPG